MPTSAEGRVEYQKLNQTTALLLFGWVFGVQRKKSVPPNGENRVVTVSAEARAEYQKLNQTTALLFFGWVFGVQLNYSCRLKSVSATTEKRVKEEFSCLSEEKVNYDV